MLESLFNLEVTYFLLIGILGHFAHGLKLWLTQDLSGSLMNYFFKNNIKRTVGSLMTTVGALATIVLSDQIPDKVGALVMLAFTTGYTSDSVVNKDQPR